MKIILIRHGKVCYKWRGLVTSEGFNQACIGYDNGEIKIDEVPQRDLDIDLIYISGLQRGYMLRMIFLMKYPLIHLWILR